MPDFRNARGGVLNGRAGGWDSGRRGFLFAREEWMTSSDNTERKAPPPFPRTTLDDVEIIGGKGNGGLCRCVKLAEI